MIEIIFLGIALFALIFARKLALDIKKKKIGDKKVEEICSIIHEGAMTFLHRVYRILILFVIIVTILLYCVIIIYVFS